MKSLPRVMLTLLLLLVTMTAATSAPPSPASTAEPPARISGSEKVQINLVLIDLVVRDRKDRPVSGLNREDFELLIDRLPVKPSDIETFEEVCPAQQEAVTPPPASPPKAEMPPAAAPPVSVESAATRHIVLYFDFSQLTFSARRQALKSAREHIATQVGPNDRVMILAFKNSLRLIQDFTSDGALLASRLADLASDSGTLDTDVLDEGRNIYDIASKPCDATGTTCSSQRALAAVYATQEETRARRSLHTLEGIMPSLAGLKGRKALVLFTDVLRDEPGVQYVVMAGSTPKSEGINLEPDLLRLAKEANAAGVSIYTVHASGLDDSTISQFRDAKPDNTQVTSLPEKPGTASRTFEAARTGLDSALALQTTVATETGGRALLRTNDVGSVLQTARQDLSCYYLLGYHYKGRGDNTRHSIIVRLRPDATGDARRGLTVRHRPYYDDMAPADRRARLLRSALDAPDLYHVVPVAAEAFALAPERLKRRVLLKASVPLSALSLLPSGQASLEGHVVVSGEVSLAGSSGKPACSFEHEVPLKVSRSADTLDRLVFETGCVLEPGQYDLAIVVLDPTTQDIGARRAALVVQPANVATNVFVSDVALWTRDPRALVVSIGSEDIGMKSTSSEAAFVPRAERRLAKGEAALMSFLLCPAAGSPATPGNPIRVHRTLLGAENVEVASFKDLVISEPPDEVTGCYQIFNTIPANTLGDGIYRFSIMLMGSPLGAPVTREAALAVD